MKRLAILPAIVLAAACAVPIRTPAPPTPPPAPDATLVFDINACEDAACTKPVVPATVKIQLLDGSYQSHDVDAAGYTAFTVPTALGRTRVLISAEGFELLTLEGFAPATCSSLTVQQPCHNVEVLKPAHVDPSSIPREELAAVRGAMWPQGLGLPLGPRPGASDNIIATDFFHNYSDGDQRRILTWENEQAYRHVVLGPLVDSDGYHGIYRPTDWREHWEEFLDIHQQFYDNIPPDGSRAYGQIPITFIHPDGWTFEETRDLLTPFLLEPRAQRLIRFAVVGGWEPTRYGWSSCTWARFVTWGRRVLPNAIIAIHTVTDVDAPVGQDALCDDDDKAQNPAGNGNGWQRVADAGLDVWLVQNGAFDTSPARSPSIARDFCGYFDPGALGAETHGGAWHFDKGIASWPTNSGWGDGKPIRMVAAEHTSYVAFWSHISEADRQDWGDLAISCHAAGYLDGGRVAVPVVH